jgi:hypothetical protein
MIIKKQLISIFIFFIFLFWISIGDEIYFFQTCKYKIYEIEITTLNNNTKTIYKKLPEDIYIFIADGTHKNKYFSNLDYTVKRKSYMLLGGHTYLIENNVKSFKIKNPT